MYKIKYWQKKKIGDYIRYIVKDGKLLKKIVNEWVNNNFGWLFRGSYLIVKNKNFYKEYWYVDFPNKLIKDDDFKKNFKFKKIKNAKNFQKIIDKWKKENELRKQKELNSFTPETNFIKDLVEMGLIYKFILSRYNNNQENSKKK